MDTLEMKLNRAQFLGLWLTCLACAIITPAILKALASHRPPYHGKIFTVVRYGSAATLGTPADETYQPRAGDKIIISEEIDQARMQKAWLRGQTHYQSGFWTYDGTNWTRHIEP
jgi:hypothetical protein